MADPLRSPLEALARAAVLHPQLAAPGGREDGLAAYGDDGVDLMLAMARRIVSAEEDAASVESVFAHAQQIAADADALLVDAEWRVPEPVTVEVVAVGAVVAGRSDEASEPQRVIFSWVEFMAEAPDEPKRRHRDEAPTLSLFEWALERERERGTGCHSRRAGRSV